MEVGKKLSNSSETKAIADSFLCLNLELTAVPKDIPSALQIKLCYDSKKEQSDNRALWPLLGFIIFTIDGEACK